MSAYRMWTLTCDGCGEIHDSGLAFTRAEAERAAKAEGWTRKGRSDHYCPGCSGTHLRTAGGGFARIR